MLISFGVLNKKLLIPFIFPFFVKLRRFIRDEEYKKIKNPFFKIFCTFLSFTLSIFFYLIVICRIKKETYDKNNKKKEVKNLSGGFLLVKKKKGEQKELIDLNKNNIDNPIKEQQKQIEKNINKKKFLFILFLMLLQMIALLIQDIWKEYTNINYDYRQTIAVLFESLFLVLFSMIFLKFQIYFHQKFALIILIVCLMIFYIETLIYSKDDFYVILKNILYFSSSQIFYCIDNVLGKKYLNLYIDNVYLFLFKIGILGLISILLYDVIIAIFFNDINNHYHGIITYFNLLFKNSDKIYLFLLDLFFGFIWEISLWLTIFYFSPLHFIILEVLGEFIETTFNIIEPGLQNNRTQYKPGQIITFYILYPIVIICVLIFNEIIILNFCGLNFNTKYQINLRQIRDTIHDNDKNLPNTLNSDEEEDIENEDESLFA